MRTILKNAPRAALMLAMSALVSGALASAAVAAEYTKGVVKKVDAAAMKVTLTHEDLKNLEMPGMTMVFRIADPALVEKLKPGKDVEFVAERIDGKLTVTAVK
jgi:Cu/Ag efflux protein CusF